MKRPPPAAHLGTVESPLQRKVQSQPLQTIQRRLLRVVAQAGCTLGCPCPMSCFPPYRYHGFAESHVGPPTQSPSKKALSSHSNR